MAREGARKTLALLLHQELGFSKILDKVEMNDASQKDWYILFFYFTAKQLRAGDTSAAS